VLKVGGVTPRGEQILSVATDLFFAKGYGQVAVDEIGVGAGLSGPAIYRHFRGKGEILAALFDRAIDGVLSATGRESADPVADLEHRVRAHARYVLAHRKLASVWIREGRALSEEHRSRLRRREANYVNQWIEAIGRCHPAMSQKDAEVAALTALGTLNSVPSWPKTSVSTAQIGDTVSRFVLAGLGFAAEDDAR
jgi:AcrR family transcriptional regulator